MKYVDKNTINSIGNIICVFGTGIDAEELIDEVRDVEIVFFIDNNRSGNTFLGKPIISLERYLDIKEGIPIVVATYRFANEIIKQLDMHALDYYVWDNQNIFHTNKTIESFIEFNKKIWKRPKFEQEKSDAIVLVPYDNKHSVSLIVHTAFCANYFANKYSASIKSFYRFGGKRENVSNVVFDVYKSINVDEVIDNSLSESLRNESLIKAEKIWVSIKTWADWKNIEIDGIKIGTTIIRHMLRHFMPSFDPKDEKMKTFLISAVETFVFWSEYFRNRNVRTVLLADGVGWEGYIRDIAITKGIDTYTIGYYFHKAFFNYYRMPQLHYLKSFWMQLSENEKEKGIEWAKNSLEERLSGRIKKLQFTEDLNVYSSTEEIDVIKQNNKTKVVICPHIFEEDCYGCGEQLFDNNYLSWLSHIGDLSRKRSDIDWYLKIHPSSSKRDNMIIDDFLKKYNNITKVDRNISPIMLKKKGIKWALTVCGTIAQEYPIVGIEVINAGDNLGETFDFAWNPKTKNEFDELINNINNLQPKNNIEDIYKFYATYYYYYDNREYSGSKLFFTDERLEWNRLKLKSNGYYMGAWMYDVYMREWNSHKQKQIEDYMPQLFKELDEWDEKRFYRKNTW